MNHNTIYVSVDHLKRSIFCGELFDTGAEINAHLGIEDPIPPDAVLTNVRFSPGKGELEFVFEHPSFRADTRARAITYHSRRCGESYLSLGQHQGVEG